MADITVQGNTTAAPELRFTPNGGAVLNFNLAENHRKKQGDTFVDDGTTFYRVAVWGKAAETLADNLAKGQRVLVTGRFRGNEFEGKNGTVKTYEVTANHVGVVPKGEPQQGGYGNAQNSQQGGNWGAPQNAPEVPF